MSLETIRLTQRAKEQLTRVKRDTGIKNWNVLARWALMLSLAEDGPPAPAALVYDSSVEMSWRTFGGADADIYLALVRERCFIDGLPDDIEAVEEQFRLHLNRGIGYLFGNPQLKDLASLLEASLD